MRRIAGIGLIAHGLAHALAGMTASWTAVRFAISVHDWNAVARGAAGAFEGLVALLWIVALVGFVAAGCGALGLGPFARSWRNVARVSAIASLGLLAVSARLDSLPGAAISLAVLIVLRLRPARAPGDMAGTESAIRPSRHGRLRAVANVAVACALVAMTAWLAVRPWANRWGTSLEELALPLPGDGMHRPHSYLVQHTVGIHAPASTVYAWLIQIGQDRGGFYSYEWLENLHGLRIHNAERIVPAWQDRRVGDFIPAAPPDWLGGRLRDRAGWRVAVAERNRALVLEGWGAFVLLPVDSSHTRLAARGGIGLDGWLPLRPLDLFLFEGPHFLMQRKMLLTLRERSERPPPAD